MHNGFRQNTHSPKFSDFRQTIIPLRPNGTEGPSYALITTRCRTVPRIKPLTRLASARSIAKAAKLRLPALSASEKTGLSLNSHSAPPRVAIYIFSKEHFVHAQLNPPVVC